MAAPRPPQPLPPADGQGRAGPAPGTPPPAPRPIAPLRGPRAPPSSCNGDAGREGGQGPTLLPQLAVDRQPIRAGCGWRAVPRRPLGAVVLSPAVVPRSAGAARGRPRELARAPGGSGPAAARSAVCLPLPVASRRPAGVGAASIPRVFRGHIPCRLLLFIIPLFFLLLLLAARVLIKEECGLHREVLQQLLPHAVQVVKGLGLGPEEPGWGEPG